MECHILFHSRAAKSIAHIRMAQRWALLIIRLCCQSPLLCIQNVIVVNYKMESINAARYAHILECTYIVYSVCVVAAAQRNGGPSMQNSFAPNSMQWEMCVKFMLTRNIGQNGCWLSLGWLIPCVQMTFEAAYVSRIHSCMLHFHLVKF